MIPTFLDILNPSCFCWEGGEGGEGGGPPKAISFSRFAAHFEVSRQRKKSAPSLLRWHGGREGDGKRRISFNYEAFWREESVWQRCQSSLDEIEAQERECCRKDVNSLSKSFFSIERRRRLDRCGNDNLTIRSPARKVNLARSKHCTFPSLKPKSAT